MQSKILYKALKLVEEVYDESMYGVDDIYRIKDIVHSVDKNHWESKKWLANKLFELYGHDAGKFYIAGGWYGMMAYQLRQAWPEPQMNIISADCDPMCEEYAWKLFDDYDISFKTIDVNDEQDFSEYSGIINTSCEHMEQEDLISIIEKKPEEYPMEEARILKHAEWLDHLEELYPDTDHWKISFHTDKPSII